LGEACGAAQVNHALEVVGHDGDADFGFGALQYAEQQAWVAEDVVLERGEGVLDDRSPKRINAGVTRWCMRWSTSS
jgi:hypothetical protein